MNRLRLPIGIQNLREIREEGYYYVDKTELVKLLVHDTKHNFLSRPRRFGKSLLVDTLKELFEGNEGLFRGLATHSSWDWSVCHPVVHLSFGSGDFSQTKYLMETLDSQISSLEEESGIPSSYTSPPVRLGRLIKELRKLTGKNVIFLVDEYDKPILDVLGAPEVARANREVLRGVYSVIEDRDSDIRFSFITGVSRFSKVSLFSGVNNLWDMTLDPRYSSLCGYTDAELDHVFSVELEGLDRAKIREWYNGYSWLGDEKVYNPYCILSLLKGRRYRNWWYETGTPTFLLETLRRNSFFPIDLHHAVGDDALLQTFDVDNIAAEALLFQTGYLTVTGFEGQGEKAVYHLGYPNREVRESLHRNLFDSLLPKQESKNVRRRMKLREHLASGDLDSLKDLLQSVLASIPYSWHTRGDLATYEAYFASVVYSYFIGAEADPRVEEIAGRGRIDLTVESEENVYIFEFKVLNGNKEGAALAQIKDRNYAGKYRHIGKQIYLVGAEFNSKDRSLARFDVERV